MPQQLLTTDLAIRLYDSVSSLPLICPHGHVNPALFAQDDYKVGSPVDLLIIPDHYVFRMLYSQGIALEDLGIPRADGSPVESDHRKIWRTFAEHFYLFRGTPTGLWLNNELRTVFGVEEKLSGDNADAIYEHLAEQLKSFRPRDLFQQFNIEVLATTDAATDSLEHHLAIRGSDWSGTVIPTFRPDAVINMHHPSWRTHLDKLSDCAGITVKDYETYIQALESRREFFKSMGATATDHGAPTAYTERLSSAQIEAVFQRGLLGEATAQDATRFTGHMMMEMARMSIEDGLVMQFHVGSFRNHNPLVYMNFGADMGADIPMRTEFTHALQPLLGAYGNDPRLRMIIFTLDESTYSRELAPLAGHYPALMLGPPWWFFDSPKGMQRYLDAVVETAGIYNTAGFNDDTRAFPSIPARHDVWRRVCANWLAGLVEQHMIDEDDAQIMIADMAYHLAKRAYRLP